MTAPYEHVDLDDLAALAAQTGSDLTDTDVLTAEQARHVRSHLSSCGLCQDTFDALLAVPAALASFPAPPAPVDVTARVLAAIQHEVATRTAEGSSVRSLDAARTRPISSGRGRRSARVGAALLATAAALGIGYVVVDGAMVGGGDDPADMSAESLDGADAPAPMGSLDEGAAFVLTSATLEEGVRVLLADGPSAETTTERVPGEVAGDNPVQGEDGELPPLLTFKPTDQCVQVALDRAGTPRSVIATEIASFDDAPAVVVVLSKPGAVRNSDVDVWILSSSCLTSLPSVGSGVADDAEAGQQPVEVLAHQTVTR